MANENSPAKPGADDMIQYGSRSYLRFHPVHRKITDGSCRCIACGQIDEPDVHVAEWCPGSGGALPFPTSTLKLHLKSDSGFNSKSEHRLTLDQWVRINAILGEVA